MAPDDEARPVTHVIGSDAEALEVAGQLAAAFAETAADRDRNRRLPEAELDQLSDAGLFGITVPRALGGAEVSVATLTEVHRLLASADGSLGQIPLSHFVFLEALRLQASPEQQERFFAEALAGKRFANAQSERGGKTMVDDATTLADGVLDGEKFYCTGALFAHWLVVRAVVPDGSKALAYVRRQTPGVTVEDDWDGLGQRTTASGTVRLDRVTVPDSDVVPYTSIFDGPTTYGSRAQVLHAALDAGIARGAFDVALTTVAKARPWFESGADTAAEDPLLVQQVGELAIQLRGAEALLREAAQAIDAAERNLTDASTAEASVATAIAKVACARVAIDVSAALFELGGTRTSLASLGLDRFWRDARTHTLHDPSRWKVQHVGRWSLTGTPPPRHGLL